jgi:hypothetical protein
MNQDKDDILALRVENAPKPQRVEARRVVATPSLHLEQMFGFGGHPQAAMTQQQQAFYNTLVTARQQAPLTGMGGLFATLGSPLGGY